MNQRKTKILFWVGGILIIILLIFLGFALKLDTVKVRELILLKGILGPVILIIADALSIIISPLTSFPLWLTSLAVFGFWPSLIYIYIGNNIGNITAFLISKYYGRPIVKKLVGIKNIGKVDEFVSLIGVKPLFLIRLFAGAASDYISYAAGLTNISVRTYILVNSVATIPSIIIQLLILERTISVNPAFFIAFVVWGYAAAFGLSIYLYKKNKPQKLI